MKFENCSLYHQGFMGYSKLECKWVDVEIKPYAQYPAAIHVLFLQKNKRKPQGFVQGYRPTVVVAAGHGNPDPAAAMVFSSAGDGFSVYQSAYSSCDPRWNSDFKSVLLPKLEVLFDGHGFDTMSAENVLHLGEQC